MDVDEDDDDMDDDDIDAGDKGEEEADMETDTATQQQVSYMYMYEYFILENIPHGTHFLPDDEEKYCWLKYLCVCLQAPDDHSECDADLLVIAELGIHEKVHVHQLHVLILQALYL